MGIRRESVCEEREGKRERKRRVEGEGPRGGGSVMAGGRNSDEGCGGAWAGNNGGRGREICVFWVKETRETLLFFSFSSV